MDVTHIALTDITYDKFNHLLTNGQPYVMFWDGDHNRIKVVLKDGYIMGLLNGQLVPVINETTAMIIATAKPDENHIRINVMSLKVSKKKLTPTSITSRCLHIRRAFHCTVSNSQVGRMTSTVTFSASLWRCSIQ